MLGCGGMPETICARRNVDLYFSGSDTKSVIYFINFGPKKLFNVLILGKIAYKKHTKKNHANSCISRLVTINYKRIWQAKKHGQPTSGSIFRAQISLSSDKKGNFYFCKIL